MFGFTFTPEMQISIAIIFFALSCGLVFIAVKTALDEARQTSRRLAPAGICRPYHASG